MANIHTALKYQCMTWQDDCLNYVAMIHLMNMKRILDIHF